MRGDTVQNQSCFLWPVRKMRLGKGTVCISSRKKRGSGPSLLSEPCRPLQDPPSSLIPSPHKGYAISSKIQVPVIEPGAAKSDGHTMSPT